MKYIILALSIPLSAFGSSGVATTTAECPVLNGVGISTTHFSGPNGGPDLVNSASIKTTRDANGITQYLEGTNFGSGWIYNTIIADGKKRTKTRSFEGNQITRSTTATCQNGKLIVEAAGRTAGIDKSWMSDKNTTVVTKTENGYSETIQIEARYSDGKFYRSQRTVQVVFKN